VETQKVRGGEEENIEEGQSVHFGVAAFSDHIAKAGQEGPIVNLKAGATPDE
jgi:hypothetical protein